MDVMFCVPTSVVVRVIPDEPPRWAVWANPLVTAAMIAAATCEFDGSLLSR